MTQWRPNGKEGGQCLQLGQRCTAVTALIAAVAVCGDSACRKCTTTAFQWQNVLQLLHSLQIPPAVHALQLLHSLHVLQLLYSLQISPTALRLEMAMACSNGKIHLGTRLRCSTNVGSKMNLLYFTVYKKLFCCVEIETSASFEQTNSFL